MVGPKLIPPIVNPTKPFFAFRWFSIVEKDEGKPRQVSCPVFGSWKNGGTKVGFCRRKEGFLELLRSRDFQQSSLEKMSEKYGKHMEKYEKMDSNRTSFVINIY